ncbi:MAG: hypothetical protein KDN19_04510 [Verrucomicrobiae bacterium]|nr:hypothetical protein [Verrucomicrobiae bacterium]
MIAPHQYPISQILLAAGVFLVSTVTRAENTTAGAAMGAEIVAARDSVVSELTADGLPVPVTSDNFSELTEHSPFLRPLNLSQSLILTGIARIEDETVATMLDSETYQSYVVTREPNRDGWQLVEVNGDLSDLETLTARIKVAGAEVVSVRYEESPPTPKGTNGRPVMVSSRIGDGTRGGGTGPHGGPDPRVLTPDQLSDARNAARNIRDGFKADGYGDRETIPPEVVSKISRLSVQQRESINVKMFEYRNRGLGMPERKKIYNNLLDQELKRR